MHRVELKVSKASWLLFCKTQFLMHRVELKAFCTRSSLPNLFVPNAPCGVESNGQVKFYTRLNVFLMHRVELKGCVLCKGSRWRDNGS